MFECIGIYLWNWWYGFWHRNQRQLQTNPEIEPTDSPVITHPKTVANSLDMESVLVETYTQHLFIISDVSLYRETHFCCDYVASSLNFHAQSRGENTRKSQTLQWDTVNKHWCLLYLITFMTVISLLIRKKYIILYTMSNCHVTSLA